MQRSISFSEVSTALDCQARHAFAYTGHLTGGDALRPKLTAPILREGRAWGAAVAALHANATGGSHPDTVIDADQLRIGAYEAGIEALDEAMDEDAERMEEFGNYDAEHAAEQRTKLVAMLGHYAESAWVFPMDLAVERELNVPVPAWENPAHSSSRYRYLAYLDGTSTAYDLSETWLVEFKLRGQLTSADQIARSRQVRWYAWAFWKATGVKPTGVRVVERLNAVPKPARINQGGKVSHAKDQLTTERLYLAACAEYGEEPNPETSGALGRRRWQQVVPVMLTGSELDDAGRDLASAARMIGELDRGALRPLRNAKQFNCARCPFRDPCDHPDPELIDALYERTVPKYLRTPNEEESK